MATKKATKKPSSKTTEILSYPIVLRGPIEQHLLKLLDKAKQVGQEYLQCGYCDDILAILQKSGRAYHLLEPLGMYQRMAIQHKLPSRVNRGILEVAGQTLRAVGDRKRVFDELQALGIPVEEWNYQKLQVKDVYEKSQYVENIKEAVLRFIAKNQRPPENFWELQPHPKRQNAKITYSPDDGQAIQIMRTQAGVVMKFKVPSSEEDGRWEWQEMEIPLPAFLHGQQSAAPDLRLACVRGKWLPVLDYKVKRQTPDQQESPFFLTVDWGTRKLVTLCVFNEQGQQVTRPMFLKFNPIKKRLMAIRNEISHLAKKRNHWPANSSQWKKYQKAIAQRWSKFRSLNKSLAHIASSAIVLIAQYYQCSNIYVEWLKSLKSKKKSSDLNWLINSTVRQSIYSKVAYKANLVGIQLAKPLSPAYTSSYCPRCGVMGIHTKAPHLTQEDPKGGWFRCPKCGLNADRDYIGCRNLARKHLYGNSLKSQTQSVPYIGCRNPSRQHLYGFASQNQSKPVAYMDAVISDLPLRQSSSYEQLSQHLMGWRKAVTITPSLSPPG